MPFAAARSLIRSAIDHHAFPAAAIEVGRRAGPVWQEAFGTLTYAEASPAASADTLFDLASLTKVISTTSLAMQAIGQASIGLETAVGDLLPDWLEGDRRKILVRHLLDHSSGLPAHARIWQTSSGRDDYARAIRALPLERPPGEAAVYSDLGFIVLGFVLEAAAGIRLDRQFADLDARLGTGLTFLPSADARKRTAPTEFDPWRGRLLVGEVHDENAGALAGVAGHAGLFGTASGVGAFARVVLCTFDAPTPLGTPDVMRLVAKRSAVPGSSRALGWDTMRPTSSCGTRLSADAIGHTGFTGTSVWIDAARDLYIVLLTNRVHPVRANAQLAALRPRLHDAIADDIV